MLLYVILCPLVQSKEEREAWLGILQLRLASTLYISLLYTRIQHTHNLNRSLRLSPSPSLCLSSSSHLSLLTAISRTSPVKHLSRHYSTLCQHCQAKGHCRFSQNHANPSTYRTWDKEAYPSRHFALVCPTQGRFLEASAPFAPPVPRYIVYHGGHSLVSQGDRGGIKPGLQRPICLFS